MRIMPICQVSPKLQIILVYAAGNNSKLAPLRLWIPNLADRDKDHL